MYTELSGLIEAVRLKYVPDRRDDVFEVGVFEQDGKQMLRGVTTVPASKRELLESVVVKYPQIMDEILLLPDESVGDKIYGVVNVSVADLRMAADYDAGMGTQLLLGQPVRVLQHDKWWRVKTPEGYVAWIPEGSFTRLAKEEFNEWVNAPKIVFTDLWGYAYEEADSKKGTSSDLVFCNLLKFEGEQGAFYKVSYPDGRKAFVLKEQSMPYDEWLSTREISPEKVLEKALKFKGFPYIWGGTSSKGLDCSGFIKTVMLHFGIILRRDASQQAKTGIQVDISGGYGNLQPADLMFFGKKAEGENRERIRHVAFYMGNNLFIHAASSFVRISSLDPSSDIYDELNTTEFIRATRILGAIDTEGIWTMNKNPLYTLQK